VREKYFWLVADKPSEQGERCCMIQMCTQTRVFIFFPLFIVDDRVPEHICREENDFFIFTEGRNKRTHKTPPINFCF
jgi:hypothetical protein